MTKKMFFPLVGFVLLAFLFSITLTTPLLAQEEKKEEDIEDFSLEDLLNVEITAAGKKAEKISDIPASVVLVTREDIEKYGYSTLSEVLESVPGLYNIRDNGYGGGFGIRGFYTYDARNIVILVNEVKMYEGYFSTYSFNHIGIPVEAIDRIEVIRGPMSVMYGSGAFFGVINIKTNIVDENSKSIVAASYGSEETSRLAGRFVGANGDFKYSMNVGLYNTAGPDEPLSTVSSNPATYAGLPDTTKDRLEDGSKFFNFYGTYKDFYTNLVYNSRTPEEYFFLPSASNGYKITYDYINATTGYKKDFSEKASIDFKFTYGKNVNDRRADYFYPDYRGTEFQTATFFDAELLSIFTPTEKLNLVIGANYNTITDVRSRLTHNDFGLLQYGPSIDEGESIDTMALFLQADYQLMDKLKVVAGIRLEKQSKYQLYHSFGPGGAAGANLVKTLGVYDKSDIEFIPRFAAIYSINDNNILKFMFGTAINRPSFFQSSQQVVSGFDPLESEDITTIELNYIGNYSSKVSLTLSVFLNTLKNLMTRTHFFDANGEYHSFFGNGGELETKGAEVSLLVRPSQKFKLDLSLTYQDTTDKRPGYGEIEIGYHPSILANFKATYNISKDISIAVTGNYVDEMETLWDGVADPSLGGGRIAMKVDSYLNLGANLRINNLFGKGFYLNIRGTNLLDKVILYPQSTNNASWADKGAFGLIGVKFMGTIGLKF